MRENEFHLFLCSAIPLVFRFDHLWMNHIRGRCIGKITQEHMMKRSHEVTFTKDHMRSHDQSM